MSIFFRYRCFHSTHRLHQLHESFYRTVSWPRPGSRNKKGAWYRKKDLIRQVPYRIDRDGGHCAARLVGNCPFVIACVQFYFRQVSVISAAFHKFIASLFFTATHIGWIISWQLPGILSFRVQADRGFKGEDQYRSETQLPPQRPGHFQFAISIFLIVGTIVVYRQLNYIQTTKLGFNKDQVLIINSVSALGNKAESFKNDVLNMQGVSSGTLSGYLPVTSSSRSDNTFSREAVMDSRNGLNMQSWIIDQDYVKTMGMQIVKGRDFSKDFLGDSLAMIINETTAGLLGYEDPVGKTVYGNNPNGTSIPYTVIGVVRNFHFESLRETIGPLCLLLGHDPSFASFKVSAGNVRTLVSLVEAKWKTMIPSVPFSYRFLDDAFDEMYRAEQRVGKVALSFAILAIFIACLGLFGLATYMAEQRTKEIGVRKVLGATIGNIATMLSGDF